MPSNQLPTRSLTRPRHRVGTFISASPLVARAGRFLTLFSTCFLFISFLFAVRSLESSSSGKKSLERYAGFVSEKVRGSTRISEKDKRCIPTKEPGWMEIEAQTDLPIWNTFQEGECSTSRFVSDLHLHAMDHRTSVKGGEGLYNKTVLVVGDVEPTKRRLTGLCEIIGGTLGQVTGVHPWGRALKTPGRNDGLDLGSYCYLPSHDLLLHHLPHKGILSSSPSLKMTLRSILPPFLTMLTSTSPQDTSPSTPPARHSTIPDLVVFSSYTSDVQQWILQDALLSAKVGSTEPPRQVSAIDASSAGVKMTRQRLEEWQGANKAILKTLDDILISLRPSTYSKSGSEGKLLWMSGGYGDVDLNRVEILGGSSEAHPLPALHSAQTQLLSSLLLPPSSTPLTFLKGELQWSRLSSSLSYSPPSISPHPSSSSLDFGLNQMEGPILPDEIQRQNDEHLALKTRERTKREIGIWGEMLLSELGEG